MNRLALTMIAFLLPLAALADIYKWTESDGTVQYSSEPPQGRPYEVIKKAPGPRNYDPSVLENSRRQLREARERAAEQQARRDLETKDKAAADKMAKNCGIARENLGTLEAHTGILRQDAKTGTVVRLTEEERRAQIEKVQKDIAYFCDEGTVSVSTR